MSQPLDVDLAQEGDESNILHRHHNEQDEESSHLLGVQHPNPHPHPHPHPRQNTAPPTLDHNPSSSFSSSSPTTPVPQRKPALTFLNGVSLVLGLQIGSGIFLTPSQVARNVPNPATGIVVWFLGGLLVWTGVCSFIELGTCIATNGGLQEYLRHCYGEFWGAFFSWTWVVVARSATMAVVAGVFAEYLCKAAALLFVTGDDVGEGVGEVSMVVVKLVGLVGLWVICVLNWTGPKAGADFAVKFLVVKIGALALIAVSGFIYAGYHAPPTSTSSGYGGWFGADPEEVIGDGPSGIEQMSRFVTAMFAALFSYNGFESIGFVLGDVHDPVRTLPRILHTAMTIVITGFILTNMSLYMTLSMEELRSTNTPTISFATKVLGPIGRVVLSLVVALSALGSLNANLFATASLSVAASQRGYFPKVLGNLHCSSQADEEEHLHDIVHGYSVHASGSSPTRHRTPRQQQESGLKGLFRTTKRYLCFPAVHFSRMTARNRWEKGVPVYAMTLNAILVSIYLVLGTYDDLVTFIGISQYLYYMLAVCGVFIIRRRRRRQQEREEQEEQGWEEGLGEEQDQGLLREGGGGGGGEGGDLRGERQEQGYHYRTGIWNPVIFTLCSCLIVVRGIMSNLAHGVALCVLGAVVWVVRSRS